MEDTNSAIEEEGAGVEGKWKAGLNKDFTFPIRYRNNKDNDEGAGSFPAHHRAQAVEVLTINRTINEMYYSSYWCCICKRMAVNVQFEIPLTPIIIRK